MAGIGGKVAPQFRQKFSYVNRELVHWFPGHMRKGLQQMQQRLKNVDCVIEVHDARVPLSGRFTEYRNTVSGLKPHIFVLNKKDLADLKRKKEIVSRLKNDGLENVLFTDFRDQQCSGLKKILPLAIKLISESNRYNRSENEEYQMMVIGVPNVGKSSLINRMRNKHLRRGNATAVGGVAGITRSVLTRIKINENPSVYLLDTPGILEPQVRNIETGLKLAAVCCLQDHLVGSDTIADYILYWMNKRQNFKYVEKLQLPEPNDNILEVLTLVAENLGKKIKVKNFDGRFDVKPDYKSAAEHFLRIFRSGELGKFCLDENLLDHEEDT